MDLEAPTHRPDAHGIGIVPEPNEPRGTVDLGSGRRTRSGTLDRPVAKAPGRSTRSGTRGAGPTLVEAGTGVGGTQRPGTTRLGGSGPAHGGAARAVRAAARAVGYTSRSLRRPRGLVVIALGRRRVHLLAEPAATALPPETMTGAPAHDRPAPHARRDPAPHRGPAPDVRRGEGQGGRRHEGGPGGLPRGQTTTRRSPPRSRRSREDPGNAGAQKLVENALDGQKAPPACERRTPPCASVTSRPRRARRAPRARSPPGIRR